MLLFTVAFSLNFAEKAPFVMHMKIVKYEQSGRHPSNDFILKVESVSAFYYECIYNSILMPQSQ